MSRDPWRTPVILGVGQTTDRERVAGPLDLAEVAAREALDDASGIAPHVGRLEVVGIIFGGGPAPASALARRLGLRPRATATTTIGGNTPQWLVGRAADDVARGAVDAVLIAGAEAPRHQAPPAEDTGEAGTATPDPVIGDPRPGLSDAEIAAGMTLPAHVYPMFENVLAARAGRDPATHRRVLGELLAPFTRVAAAHPHAWFRRELTAGEISTPGPGNRLTAEPYTKLMNAFLGSHQGAALVVTSLGRARALGLADRAVWIWSAADANDVWWCSARPDPVGADGLRAAVTGALEAAGAGTDDLAHLDVYSCFPVAVELAAEALGVSPDDPRGLTVTGGLPYFGGPGNNYVTHALATLVDRLRDSGGDLGLVTGLGWYLTKHAVGVYGRRPPPDGYRRADLAGAQARIDASARPLAPQPERPVAGTVVAGTVTYRRSGEVASAPVIVELDDGSRLPTRIAEPDPGTLAGLNPVGWRVEVVPTREGVTARVVDDTPVGAGAAPAGEGERR